MARPTIAEAAIDALTTRRVMTTDEIVAVVLERGLTRAKDPLRAVRAALDASPMIERLDDGRWTSMLVLLDEAVLTHELTAAEAEAGALAVAADIAALWRVAGSALTLPGGDGPDRLHFSEASRKLGSDVHRGFAGPAGWLPATPGAFLHLRVAGRTLQVEEGPRPAPTARVAERRLARVARACLDRARSERDEDVVDVARVVAQALVEAPDLLREPIPPLGTILADAGLEVFETLVGPAGTDWRGRGWAAMAALTGTEDDGDDEDDLFDEGEEEDEDDLFAGPEALAAEVARLRERYDLEDLEVRLLEFLLGNVMLERLGAGPTDETSLRADARALSNPVLASILAERAYGVEAIRTLLERIVATVDPAETAGVQHVLGVVADLDGDPDEAERLFRTALRLEPRFWPSLIALALLAEEQGDLAEALRLVTRAGMPADSPMRTRLTDAVTPVGRKVGRNDPCPCGSGRKSKVCHPEGIGAVRLPPARLLRWILDSWESRPDVEVLTHALLADAGIRDEHPEDTEPGDDGPDDDHWRRCHLLAADIALFDAGRLEKLLRSRGHRLPQEVRALAGEWLETRRALVEVRAVTPGRGVTVRDVLDGTLHEVEDRAMARQLRPLDLFCGRILPNGAGGWLAGDGIIVPRAQREHVAAIVRDGHGLELLEWLDDPTPPLRLRTPEGDELEQIEATWVVPNDAAARTGLAAAPDVRSDGADSYTLVQGVQGRDSIVGTIRFDGDEATLEAMSQPRYGRLVALLRSVAPRARVMRAATRSAIDLVREARERGPLPEAGSPGGPLAGPEVEAFLDGFMREQERRWVDESIPALGGLTPRQALDDPVGRPKLDRLLDDFAWQERQEAASGRRPGAAGMQVRRIRALLGIGLETGAD